MTDRVRIGVFGSLCNPPHLGHLVLCAEAAWQLGLERVLLVPTARPPHRAAPAEPFAVRAELADALALDLDRLEVCRIEDGYAGPSYTATTLRALQERHHAAELHLLIGADQLEALDRWHEAERIPDLARIAVADRPGVVISPGDPRVSARIAMPAIGISSSDIRERAVTGRPYAHLVGGAVARAIEAGGLYRG